MLALVADWVFLVHGAFVVLALPSAVLAYAGYYRGSRVLWRLHNLAIAIMVAGRASLGRCPLVVLEEALRHRAGDRMPYTGGYVAYLFRTLLGVAPPPGTVMAMSAVVAAISVAAIVRHRGRAGEGIAAPDAVRIV
jgi:hypothetical protein